MLTAQGNATIVRAHYDAFNRRDIDKSLALVTEDVKWTNIPFNARFTGRKGFREFLDNWSTAMPDCRVEILNVVANGEWTAIEYIGQGKHMGSLVGPQGPILATYKTLDLEFCELLRITDGQIAEGRLYFDAATMMSQLGVPPQNPPPGQRVDSGR